MKNMIFADYAIVGIYMAIMMGLGIFVSKYNKNDGDYFKGGNKVPWGMSGFSCFIGLVSGYMFVAASSRAYSTGFACIPLFSFGAWGTFFCAFLMMARWRRLRITSPMEYIEKRFCPLTRDIFTVIQVIAYIIAMGSMLYVLSIFISSALGLKGTYEVFGIALSSLHLCIIITGVVIMFYTAIGGLWAVVVTDTVQFFIVMVVAIIMLPLSLKVLGGGSVFGGIDQFINNPPTPDYFKIIKPSQTLSFVLAFSTVGAIATAGHFSMIQRAVCVPDEKDARKVGITAAILNLLVPGFWLLPVFFMRSLIPDLTQAFSDLENPYDGTYVAIARILLPNGMIGLTIAAILAATMSTMSTLFNISSMIITENIYKQFFAKKASPRHLLFAGKILTLVVGILAIVIGILMSSFKDAFGITLLISSHFGIVFGFPVIVGILFRRIPWWSALVSMPLSLMYTLSLEFFVPGEGASTSRFIHHLSENLVQYKIFGAVVLNALVFIIATRFYNEKDPKNKPGQQLFELLKKPTYREGDASPVFPNLRPYRLVGWTLLIFGIVVILSGIFISESDTSYINFIAGIVFISICLTILWVTHPRYSPVRIIREQEQLQREPDELSNRT
jgi:solute:Na+ symporter, SSS family